MYFERRQNLAMTMQLMDWESYIYKEYEKYNLNKAIFYLRSLQIRETICRTAFKTI